MTQITINLQSVTDGLPPEGPDLEGYSIECMAVVDKEIFDRSVRYMYPCKDGEGWVWADLGLGNIPDDYLLELGGDTPTVTHWAPWPEFPALVPAEVAA
jgi:hypothetical protein